MTPHEDMLWQKIRRQQIHGLQFYRQKRVAGYIVDFKKTKKRVYDGFLRNYGAKIKRDFRLGLV